MKYNIIQLQHQPTGSVHCSAVKSEGKVLTYMSRSAAVDKANKLKSTNPNALFYVSKHWRG